ncbi:hypothetical protein MCBMB27_05698 (plasmid) [Methylobacterium phyllosphaerae]|uniref:Uncharacterized protein n=1 Tax=Methylobacterium phyllosphaerae TaxID=418223 RepID=A0AAE8L9I5_9HYPH|nr:hypothetical protein MCBMB27_05698 [Methylobacterium phyllosphaerae]SFH65506.1 hypothetical protein SAMN05192567_14012 [Methylobacterium phyllosphaerae]
MNSGRRWRRPSRNWRSRVASTICRGRCGGSSRRTLPAGTRRLCLRADDNLAHLQSPALSDRGKTRICEWYKIVLVGLDMPEAAPGQPPHDFLVVGRSRTGPLVATPDRRDGQGGRVLRPADRPVARQPARSRRCRPAPARPRKDGWHAPRRHPRSPQSHHQCPPGTVRRPGNARRRGPARRAGEHAAGGYLRRSPGSGLESRVGLVCVGAEAWLTRTRPLQGDDDGLLLVRDIAVLRLAGTELVVREAGEPVGGRASWPWPMPSWPPARARWSPRPGRWTTARPHGSCGSSTPPFWTARRHRTALRAVQSAWSRPRRHPRLWAGFGVHVGGEI